MHNSWPQRPLRLHLATVCIKVKRSQGVTTGDRSNIDAMLFGLCENEHP